MSFSKQGNYRFNEFEIDLAHRSLQRGGHAVSLNRRTFNLLAYLVLHPQQVVTEEELTHALGANSEEGTISQQIFLLRMALSGVEQGDRIIASTQDHGYEFTPQVTEVPVYEAEEAQLVLPPPRFSVEITDDDEEAPPLPPRRQDPDTYATNRISSRARSQETSYETSDDDKTSVPFFTQRRWQIVAVAALVLILASAWLFWRHYHQPRTKSLSIFVGNVQNTTGNPQFDQSLRAALLIDLRQSPYLRLAYDGRAHESLEAITADAASPDAATPEQARQLCARLHTDVYLDGEIHRYMSQYLVTVQAFSCANSSKLASNRGIAGSPDAAVRVIDKVAADMRIQLGESPADVSRYSKPIFPAGSGSLAALKAYADATFLAQAGNPGASIPLFQQAIRLDQQFANAYEQLGLTYSSLSQHSEAVSNLTTAFQLRSTVGERDRFTITARYAYLVTGDFQASIHNYKEAIEVYPHDTVFLAGLADLENRIGKPALALDPIRRVLELDPSSAAAYEILAGAQVRLGQFEAAAATCRRAFGRKIDTAQLHAFLLQTAFLRLDQPGIDEQLSWARGKPEEPQIAEQQGLMLLAQGRVKEAQPVLISVAEAYRKQGLSAPANRVISALARRQVELGLPDLARTQLGRLPQDDESPDTAVAWAEIGGETERADSMLQRVLEANPTATLWQGIRGPQVRAAINLSRHEPQTAIKDLEAAEPYETASFDVPALRGRAYLAAGQPLLAEAEFHKILDHPGIEPLSQNYPLAQLGLARALAAQGKPVEASFAYKVLLQIWKEANSTLPRLHEAQTEYGRLSQASARPASAKRSPKTNGQ